jgi:hypothetical protein
MRIVSPVEVYTLLWHEGSGEDMREMPGSVFVCEGAFGNGNPADGHDQHTARESYEEQDLERANQPKHERMDHGCEIVPVLIYAYIATIPHNRGIRECGVRRWFFAMDKGNFHQAVFGPVQRRS